MNYTNNQVPTECTIHLKGKVVKIISESFQKLYFTSFIVSIFSYGTTQVTSRMETSSRWKFYLIKKYKIKIIKKNKHRKNIEFSAYDYFFSNYSVMILWMDLRPVPEVTAVAAPLQSCSQNSGASQLLLQSMLQM